jgi:hypothetical protein
MHYADQDLQTQQSIDRKKQVIEDLNKQYEILNKIQAKEQERISLANEWICCKIVSRKPSFKSMRKETRRLI